MRDGVASETARRVAAQRLHFARAEASYGDPDADERLTRDVAAGMSDRRSLMTDHLAARTMYFDRIVTGAIDGGITQVVVAAAGYDGRAWRYGQPGVRFFELDHPATQADKRERVARLGLPTDHVAFVAADFADTDIAAALTHAGLDRARPSVFTVEGVAIYLDKPVLAALLRGLADVAAPGSRLAISLSIRGRGLSSTVGFRHAVARMGEPVKTLLEPTEVEPFLAEAGWRLTDAGSERARYGGLVVLEPTMR